MLDGAQFELKETRTFCREACHPLQLCQLKVKLEVKQKIRSLARQGPAQLGQGIGLKSMTSAWNVYGSST